MERDVLRNTFVHIPGIGAATEKKLWERGFVDWDELHRGASVAFRGARAESVRGALEESEQALRRRDFRHFYKALPRDQLWRLVPGNFENAAYLDIETTGMGFPPACRSTTITFYYRGKVYQEHEHARKAALVERILGQASLLVTFFGEVFDVPFLEREFGFELELAHLDLCFWLKRHGFGGGLKKVQKLFPHIPARSSLDIDGYDAVKLWRLHRRGVPGALETLLTYNAEDTIVLEPLLVEAYNLDVRAYPELGLEPLKARALPRLETSISTEVYALLRGESATAPL